MIRTINVFSSQCLKLFFFSSEIFFLKIEKTNLFSLILLKLASDFPLTPNEIIFWVLSEAFFANSLEYSESFGIKANDFLLR